MHLSVSQRLDQGVVVIGDDYALPRNMQIDVTEWVYEVTLQVEYEGDRFVVNDLHVRRSGSDPITSDGLRQLAIQRLLQGSAETALMTVRVAQPSDATDPVTTFEPAELPTDLAGTRMSTEALQQIAVIYRLAHAVGLPPTQTVAERFKLPRSTAGRWVMEARRRGLLGAAVNERKAGVVDG